METDNSRRHLAEVQMPLFEHLLLTRFNVKIPRLENSRRLDPVWLDSRFLLFEQFCYPSVRSQTNTNFTWLVLFDSKTPAGFRAKMEQYFQSERFHAVYMDLLTPQTLLEAVADYFCNRARPDYLITSRLDNDDAICREYIGWTQSAFMCQQREFLNFADGCVLSSRKGYRRYYPEPNPFISLVETFDQCQTVLHEDHSRLAEEETIRQLAHGPAWLQVVHGANLANQVSGIRYPIREILKDFAIRPADLHSSLRLYLDEIQVSASRAASVPRKLRNLLYA